VNITGKSVDPIPNAADDEYTLYVVTLKDGSKREFKRGFGPQGQFEDRVKKTGYTGDISALLAKVAVITQDSNPKNTTIPERPKRFVLSDVSTVTSRSVDSSTSSNDDEYIEYTITLKKGAVIIVKGYAGDVTDYTRDKPFRKAGFKGDVSDIILKAVPAKVLGASTSSAEAILDDVASKLDALLQYFTK
jgi:hypothetical protein